MRDQLMNIYEMYGRQAEQAQQLRAFFDSTMKLLRELVRSEVSVAQLFVTDNGWELRDPPVEPEKPVSVNGAKDSTLRSVPEHEGVSQ